MFCLTSRQTSGLSVSTGKIIAQPIRKSNLHFPAVPTIQTVKGRVVFFRKAHEKISTLKSLTVWIFAVAISPPKTGNRIKKFCPRFRLLHSNGKTVYTTSALSLGFAVALPPRPRLLPKNRMDGKGVTSPPSCKGGFRPPRAASTPFLSACPFLSQKKARL